MNEMVLVVDFGGQYNQLIARRVRESHVYSEIVSYKKAFEAIREKQPRGIILTGGPNSVYLPDSPTIGKELFGLGVPVLGICYGAQLMTHVLGGRVCRAPEREYGKTLVHIDAAASKLFEGVQADTVCWMSHNDYIEAPAPGFAVSAHTESCPVAAAEDAARGLYLVQFHPEVLHTQQGARMLSNFVYNVCGCKGTWKMDSFVDDTVAALRARVGGGRVLCALSGGVDSSLLVWAAMKYGRDWRAYYVHSAFQPAFELEDAKQVAAQCGMPLTVIEADIFQHPEVIANPANRCYYCKHRIFAAILRQGASDGYSLVIDGTNASDDAGDRPGMKALRELEVRSPLRECGLTKGDVRALCREAGLFVWNKPSYACLATRIPAGTPITEEALRKVEQGEDLLASMGFRDFRIRLRGGAAVIQVTEDQQDDAWAMRHEIRSGLGPIFPLFSLDLTARKNSD